MENHTKEIKVTEDYEIFKTMKGNRHVDKSRVDKIKKSILENGYITSPIICNENMEIVDGQGRLEALRQLGLPVEYIVHPGLSVRDCVVMNINQTSWKLDDYIESYCQIGNNNYKNLKKLLFEYPRLPIGLITFALSESKSAVGINKIKNGEFICSDEDYEAVHEDLDWVAGFYDMLAGKIPGNNKNFLIALLIVYRTSGVDVKRLENCLTNKFYEFNGRSVVLDWLSEFEKTYNYKNRSKIFFRTRFIDTTDSRQYRSLRTHMPDCYGIKGDAGFWVGRRG